MIRPKGVSRRQCLLSLGGGVASLIFARDAFAWVPSGSFILERVYERRKNMNELRVKGQLYIYDESLKGGRRQVEQTLLMKIPAKLRVEVKAPGGEYLEVADGKRRVSMRNGKVSEPKKDDADLWRALMIGDPITIKNVARSWGVDMSTVALGRLPGPDGEPRRGAICYVLGASPNPEAAMIWIEKGTYYPRLLKDAGGKDARTVALDGWEDQVARGWFPSVTTRKRGGKLLEELRADEIKTNLKLDAKLFDVSAVSAPKK